MLSNSNFYFFTVIRSQSVGPTVSDTSGSPKKQPKPMSASITAATASSAAKTHKKTPVSTPTVGDHQARASKWHEIQFSIFLKRFILLTLIDSCERWCKRHKLYVRETFNYSLYRKFISFLKERMKIIEFNFLTHQAWWKEENFILKGMEREQKH